MSYSLAAWTNPTAAPTGGNVAAPINIGGGVTGNIYAQSKSGLITLDHLITGDFTLSSSDLIAPGQILTAIDDQGTVGWRGTGLTYILGGAYSQGNFTLPPKVAGEPDYKYAFVADVYKASNASEALELYIDGVRIYRESTGSFPLLTQGNHKLQFNIGHDVSKVNLTIYNGHCWYYSDQSKCPTMAPLAPPVSPANYSRVNNFGAEATYDIP